MAEIKQKVTLDADQFFSVMSRLLDSISGLEKKLGDSARAGDETAQTDRKRRETAQTLRSELEQLVGQELAHEKALKAGAEASGESAEQSAARTQRIGEIGAALGEQRAVQERVNEAIERSASALRKAEIEEEKRAETAADLRAKLESLVRAEIEHESALSRGLPISDQDAKKSRERKAEIERLGASLGQIKSVQDRVNDAILKSTGHQREAVESTGKLDASVNGLIGRYAGFITSGAGILKLLSSIVDVSLKAVDANAKLGESLRALSVNVGGERSARIFGQVTQIAADNSFSVQGRTQLLEAISTLTDLQPDLSDTDIGNAARTLADIQRNSGVGGRGAAQSLVSAQKNLGLNREQAAQALVALFTSGVTDQAVVDITQRAGNVGGLDALALILAGREEGLDVNSTGRAVSTLIGSLSARDSDGQLAERLRRIGVTDEQSFSQRFSRLVSQRESGGIGQADFENIIGGAENLRIVQPLARAVTSGAFERARGLLLANDTISKASRELDANPFVKAQERQNLRELTGQVNRERRSALGEDLSQIDADAEGSVLLKALSPFAKITAGVEAVGRFLGFVPDLSVEQAEINRRRIKETSQSAIDEQFNFQRANAGTEDLLGDLQQALKDPSLSLDQRQKIEVRVQQLTINNISTQYQRPDPQEADSGRRDR